MSAPHDSTAAPPELPPVLRPLPPWSLTQSGSATKGVAAKGSIRPPPPTTPEAATAAAGRRGEIDPEG